MEFVTTMLWYAWHFSPLPIILCVSWLIARHIDTHHQ